jgi:hypothetical protein
MDMFEITYLSDANQDEDSNNKIKTRVNNLVNKEQVSIIELKIDFDNPLDVSIG